MKESSEPITIGFRLPSLYRTLSESYPGNSINGDVALSGTYEFSELSDPTNVLVFPNLEAGNIGYKLLQRLGDADAVGPMLVGMDEPVHVLQRGDEVKDVVNLAAVTVVDGQQV